VQRVKRQATDPALKELSLHWSLVYVVERLIRPMIREVCLGVLPSVTDLFSATIKGNY
jgi:hypothetical protein